jgi:hypothetical protein
MLIGTLLGLAVTTFLLAFIDLASSMVSILLGGFLGVLWSGRRAARGFVINESETSSVPWTRILQRLGSGVIIGLLVAVAFWLDLSPISKPSPFPQLWWLSFGLLNTLLQHLLEKNITTDRSCQAAIWQHFVRTVKSSGIGHGLLTAVLRKRQGYDKLNGILRTERNCFYGYPHTVQMASLPG